MPDHQTVAGGFEFGAACATAIEFTDQRLSPHAGMATFWGWPRPLDWVRQLTKALPQPLPTSNNHLLPIEKALAFMHGLLCDAQAHPCRLFEGDQLVPELLGIRRVASQSVLSRFFAGFTSAGVNLRCFRSLWHWGLNRLPSTKEGYTLDLDSTRLLHEDGHQEGSVRLRVHPARSQAPVCIRFWRCWLRCVWWRSCGCGPGHTVRQQRLGVLFTLWDNLPSHLCSARVRADSASACPNCWHCGKGCTRRRSGRAVEPADSKAVAQRSSMGRHWKWLRHRGWPNEATAATAGRPQPGWY